MLATRSPTPTADTATPPWPAELTGCCRLKHPRLDDSHEAELREFLTVDLLILDDFALDSMDAAESRDNYDLLTERHRAGPIIVT